MFCFAEHQCPHQCLHWCAQAATGSLHLIIRFPYLWVQQKEDILLDVFFLLVTRTGIGACSASQNINVRTSVCTGARRLPPAACI